MKFNTSGPDGLIDRKAPRQLSTLKVTPAALVEAISADSGVRWEVYDAAGR